MIMSDLIRRQGELLIATAELMEKGGASLTEALDYLNRRFPRKDALGVPEMAAYWGVAEATARERMHAADFPGEKLGNRCTVSKLALAAYEIRDRRQDMVTVGEFWERGKDKPTERWARK